VTTKWKFILNYTHSVVTMHGLWSLLESTGSTFQECRLCPAPNFAAWMIAKDELWPLKDRTSSKIFLAHTHPIRVLSSWCYPCYHLLSSPTPSNHSTQVKTGNLAMTIQSHESEKIIPCRTFHHTWFLDLILACLHQKCVADCGLLHIS
jgi:hypothetical protein